MKEEKPLHEPTAEECAILDKALRRGVVTPGRLLNPPSKLVVTFEEWWFVEFERLLASYTDWWARPNDPDLSNGEQRRNALIAHARKRIG